MINLVYSYADFLLPFVPYLLPLPVLLPAIGAALALLFSSMVNVQRTLSLGVLALLLFLNLSLVLVADVHGIQTVQIGGWDAPIGITLVADRLATLMLAISSLVLFCVMWFAIAQGVRDGNDEEPVAVFQPVYLLLSMGVSLSFLAGDLFNLYVGFEIFLAASYVLLTLGASPGRVRAGIGYVVVSIVSSMIFLFAIAGVYAAVGTVNLAQVGIRMEDVPEGTRAAIFATLLVAFGIKAAVVPLDAWLPDSYPTAPSLVTAIFAGLLTKVGVYAIIRMRASVFLTDFFDNLLLIVALATMVVGILGAMAQTDIKRLMSFTLVSHIGYMIMGIGLGNEEGLAGAIFYAVHHILVQTALFLVVGLIERQAGTSSLRRLGSLMYTAPLIAVLYFIPAINLGGIPPLSGFMGKIMLLDAAAADHSALGWLVVGGAVVTSLLTLYVMTHVWAKGFWRLREDAPEGQVALARPAPLSDITDEIDFAQRKDPGRIPFGMVASTVVLVAASTAITLVGGPLAKITDRAAASAQDPEIYRVAVLSTNYSHPGRTLEQRSVDNGTDARDPSRESESENERGLGSTSTEEEGAR